MPTVVFTRSLNDLGCAVALVLEQAHEQGCVREVNEAAVRHERLELHR